MTRAMAWTTLVSSDALAPHLGEPGLVVLDVRFSLADPAAGEAAWRECHVPGARHAHLDRDLSGSHRPGAGRHPWPAAEHFGEVLGRLGITPGHQVVAYDAADGAFAARAWCLLRLAGHARVAVLDGGFAGWQARGLPVDRHPGAVEPAPPYPVRFDHARLHDAAGVTAHLAGGGVLLDARAGERFRGEIEPIDARPGHVPGARSRPYPLNLEGGYFRSPAALAADFEALRADGNGSVVVMCGSGVTACHHLLAMEHAGLTGAGLYTGSWSGWIEDPERPVASGRD